MQIHTGPVLISKKTGEVSAYHDSAIFFTIKGSSVDTKQEGLPVEPYGIITSHYQNPFSLAFDENELTVSINPGILHVYGRQVELTEAVEVYDFHSTIESQLMYCTVYIEINLADMTRQIARLKIDIAGAAYKNFDSSMTRDNLHQLDHGVFQAPIARFQYAPTGSPHFSNSEIVMPLLDGETREATRDIRITDRINNIPLDEIANLNTQLNFHNWKKASNVEALAKYMAQPGHTTLSGGYSVAAGAEKLGDTVTHETTAINSSLTGVCTVKRIKVTSLGKWFGSSSTVETVVNGDTTKIQAIRIWFNKSAFTAKVNYQRKYLMTGWQWKDQYPDSVTCKLNPDGERWIGRENKRFCLYYYHWFYVISGAGWHSEEGLNFGTYEDFQASVGTEDAPNWSTGSTSIYSINTKRRFMDVYLTVERDKIRFKFEGRGYGSELYEFLDGWWRWCPLQDISDAGDLYIDVIYKGDVRL